MPKLEHDNTVLVYVMAPRTESDTTVQIETVQRMGPTDDDIFVASFEVDDTEPLDVWGPIFSRVFDELGLTLSDPGDFSWESVPLEPEAYLVTINCDFTEEG